MPVWSNCSFDPELDTFALQRELVLSKRFAASWWPGMLYMGSELTFAGHDTNLTDFNTKDIH